MCNMCGSVCRIVKRMFVCDLWGKVCGILKGIYV